MVRRLAQGVEPHLRVRHGGVDCAKPIVAVQPLRDESHAAFHGATAQEFWPERLRYLQYAVQCVEEQSPAAVLMRWHPPWCHAPCAEKFPDANLAGIPPARADRGPYDKSHNHAARPIR